MIKNMNHKSLSINITKVIYYGYEFDAPISAEELVNQLSLQIKFEFLKAIKDIFK